MNTTTQIQTSYLRRRTGRNVCNGSVTSRKVCKDRAVEKACESTSSSFTRSHRLLCRSVPRPYRLAGWNECEGLCHGLNPAVLVLIAHNIHAAGTTRTTRFLPCHYFIRISFAQSTRTRTAEKSTRK